MSRQTSSASTLEEGKGVPASYTAAVAAPENENQQVSHFQSFKDSFKPAKHVEIDTTGMTEAEIAAYETSQAPLKRKLKSRHLQMIAIGGSIGTGLFIGSGKALAQGGPAALVIDYLIVGVMLYGVCLSLGEIAAAFPVAGSFATMTSRFVDGSLGFAVGWIYAMMWIVVLPLELTAAAITLEFWEISTNPAAYVAIFYVFVLVVNVCGVRLFGETEFVFSFIKVIAVCGWIIFAIVYNCGGTGNDGYLGGVYWQTPGAFAHGFHGVCQIFVTAAFSFTGTELVGLAAAETDDPRRTLPTAVKQVFWRLLLFYVVSLTLIGLVIPYNDPRLMSGESSFDANASPFVIALVNAGVKGLPSVINAVVLVSVISVGSSAVYACSRTLAALGSQGYGPHFLAYIDRSGRPMVGLVITLTFGLLSFCVASDVYVVIFNWLMALTGLTLAIVWFCICVVHIRLRMAFKVQNRSLDELPFKSPLGQIGSYIGAVINVIVIVCQTYVALVPVTGPRFDPTTFFQAYLAVPIFLVLFIGHKLYTREWYVRLSDIDLDTGRLETDMDLLMQEVREEEAYIKGRGWWYRTYKIFV